MTSFATPVDSWSTVAGRANYCSRAMILDLCIRLSARVPGDVIEFGVASGDSTRVIRRTVKRLGLKKRIYACDSFEGLREKFEKAEPGTFAGKVPRISGVEIVKGYFESTLTDDLRRKIGRVSFAHLDADLYSSTLTALTWLTPLLETGSLLLFDEFTGSDFAERRAFDDWRNQNRVSVLRVAEFDREPSGFGVGRQDLRVLFQVLGDARLRPRLTHFREQLAYYLGRVGLHGLHNRLLNPMY